MTPAQLRDRALAELREARSPTWWRVRTQWLVDRPKRVIATLAVVAIVIRHSWILSTLPLPSGDWAWRDRPRLLTFFPWPSLWDPNLGPGGASRFLAAFRFPVYAIDGLLAQLGANWTVIERLLYFLPYTVLLPIGGWLLAREIMGRTRWTLLAPVVLLGNAYFLLEGNSEIPLALAEAVSFFAVVGFLRAMRQRSLGWAVVTGLLVAATTAFDIRPAYLCLVLMAMYFVVLALVGREWTVLGRRTLLGLVTVAVFIGTQAFWVVPLVTYHGNTGFPIPPTPDFSILTIGHGLTGVHAGWTGGLPAPFTQAPLNPVFTLLPILALAPLIARRLSPEIVWLGLVALLFAFFVNTDNAPFGALYDWMYAHVPGWNLFREGSKFLYVVGLAYAILIPIALRMAFDWAASQTVRRRHLVLRVGAATALGGIVALSGWTVGVLESGNLDSTTEPTPEPVSFSAMSAMLAQDSRPGAVLWFGGPVVTEGAHHHTFLISSSTHPDVNLTGHFNPGNDVIQRDPLQLYCADTLVPYCYVDPQLFPFLTRMTGADYVVVPWGPAAGSLPQGVTRSWLQQQMTSMFGQPVVLGSGNTELHTWRMASPSSGVNASSVVAAVDGGTWTAPLVLPALVAMDVPAAYAQSYDNNHYPAAPLALPDSVRVLPRSDGGCAGTAPARVAVMAQTTAQSLALTVANKVTALPLLTAASRLSGWGVYGPIDVAAGATPMAAVDTAITLGPCIAWSSLTAAALGPHSGAITNITVGSNAETVAASTAAVGSKWVELRRFYDAGWQLEGQKPSSAGDGLFNLYHIDARTSSRPQLLFSYSTLPWQSVGLGVSGAVLLVALVVAVRDLRRRETLTLEDEALPPVSALTPSSFGRWIAGIGMALLVITAVAVTTEWFGLPSAVPGTSFASDPYDLDVGYGAAAIGILLMSLVVRIVAHLLGAAEKARSVRKTALPARIGATATMLIVAAVLLTSCRSSPSDFQSMISQAQQAGATAQTVEGGSLDQARLHRTAHQPLLCIADYTTALNAFPDLAEAYVGRAACYLSGGKNSAAAVHDYSEAIMLAPARSDLLLHRALAERVSGNNDAALADYEQAALTPAAQPSEQLAAVDGLLAIDHPEAAATVYQQALQREPKSAVLRLAGADIAIATGNDQVVNNEFSAALQLAKGKVEEGRVLTRLCHHEVLRHQYDLASTDCTNATLDIPQASAAYDDLSAAQLALGNPTTALSDIDASIGAWVGDVGVYAQPAGVDGFGLAHLYSARGWIEIQLHQVGAGIADFQLALQALPSSAPDQRARLKAALATAAVD